MLTRRKQGRMQNSEKRGVISGTSGVVVEMIKAGGREITKACEQNHI